MSEDPREYGLTAADLNAAADQLYDPGDPRREPVEWTWETQARYGQIRSRLRGLADAIENAQTPPPVPLHRRAARSTERTALMTDTTPAEAEAEAIGDVATTEVTAEYYVDKTGGIPRLVVSIDFGSDLGEGEGGVGEWAYDSVISYGTETGTDLTLLFFPQGTDEGWDRIGEVGEW